MSIWGWYALSCVGVVIMAGCIIYKCIVPLDREMEEVARKWGGWQQ